MNIGVGTSLDYKQCFFNGNSIKATQLNSLFTLSINFIKSYRNIIYSQVYNNRENKNNVVERRNFILSKSFQGKGKIILIKSDSVSIKYNHDDVLDSVDDKITSLPCWEKYGYYTKTQGVPKFINNKFFEYM